jgi:hypothetical protein
VPPPIETPHGGPGTGPCCIRGSQTFTCLISTTGYVYSDSSSAYVVAPAISPTTVTLVERNSGRIQAAPIESEEACPATPSIRSPAAASGARQFVTAPTPFRPASALRRVQYLASKNDELSHNCGPPADTQPLQGQAGLRRQRRAWNPVGRGSKISLESDQAKALGLFCLTGLAPFTRLALGVGQLLDRHLCSENIT